MASFTIASMGALVFATAAMFIYGTNFGTRTSFEAVLRMRAGYDQEAQLTVNRLLARHCRAFALVLLRDVDGKQQEQSYQLQLTDRRASATLLRELEGGARARGAGDLHAGGCHRDMNASLLPVSVPTRHGIVRRTIGRIAPVLLLAGLAVWWIGRGGDAEPARRRGFSEAIPLAVASTAGGRLVELAVRVGQPVKAGDVIAKLDPQLLEVQRRKLEAERGMVAAKLAAETDREGDSVMRNEARILWTSADAQQNRAALADIENEVTRLDSLLGDQLVKASDVEPIRRERDGLAARVQMIDRARAAGQAGLGDKQEAPKGQVMGAERQAIVALRTAPLREALRIKEIKLAQLALQLGSLTLRAPADGIVSAINRRPGEMLAAGETAVLIVAHRPGLFEIYLSDREQRLPVVGTHVRLTRTGILARPFEGRVVEVSPAIVELPMRLRLSPGVPGWGRRVMVDASQSEEMRVVPAGEEVRVRL